MSSNCPAPYFHSHWSRCCFIRLVKWFFRVEGAEMFVVFWHAPFPLLEWEEQWRSSAASGSHQITASEFLYWYGTTPMFKHVLIAKCKLHGSLYMFYLGVAEVWRPLLLFFPHPLPLRLCHSVHWAVFMTADGDCGWPLTNVIVIFPPPSF